ncbi:MAG: hypothetical protein ABSC08_09480 [Bryobacteraceae bacterium]|jgi:hypothetical protein
MVVHIRHTQSWNIPLTPLPPRLAALVFLLLALLAAGCGSLFERKAPEPPPLTFELRTFEKTELGCGDRGHRDEACVSFRAAWPELKGGGGDAASKINTALFTALGFPGGATEMEPYAVALIERWRVEHKGVFYADSTWFERRTIQVMARRPEVWSFRLDRLGQTGKEMPFDQRVYLNLNPRSGSSVTLDSLLEKDAAPRLSSLAERRLRETLSLGDAAALPFKDNRFALPAQFAVTQPGLALLWSGDALADPDSPRIEVTLPWSLVRDLVRKPAVKPPGPEAETGF